MNKEIKLGDLVEDTVSGFTGVAVAKTIYFQGCNRVAIQPKIDKEGKLPKCETFDEPQLKTTKKEIKKRSAPKNNPGGPEKYSDIRRY